MLGPEGSKVDILANLAPSVHFDCFSLEFRQFQLNGTAGIRCRDLKLQFELVSNQVIDTGTNSLPTSAIFTGLNLEPIIVLLLI